MDWLIKQTVDLAQGYSQIVVWPKALLVPGDNAAHTWQVEVRENGVGKNLSSYTVEGVFVRADNTAVNVAGTKTGSVASIVFPATCYNVAGVLRAVMKIKTGEVTTSIAETYFTVRKELGETVVLPREQVANVAELYSMLEGAINAETMAMAAANAAAASAAQLAAGTASPAGTYANLAALNDDPSADVSKIYITLDDGQWCYHNGSAWVAGGVYQAASVVTEFGLIRNDQIELLNGYYPISELGFANGSVANGVWTPMSAIPNFSKRVGTPAPQKFDFDITISIDSGFRIGIVRYSDDTGTEMVSDTQWQTTPQVITAGTTFRFTISRATDEPEVASIPEFLSKCHISAGGVFSEYRYVDIPLSLLGFTRGTCLDGVYTPTTLYRVTTPFPLKFKNAVLITPSSGFRIGIVRYSDDAGTIVESDTQWKTTTQTVEADAVFRFTISRTPEDYSEYADIPTFLAACTMVGNIKDRVEIEYLPPYPGNISNVMSGLTRGYIDTGVPTNQNPSWTGYINIHRGWAGLPENTLQSIWLAKKNGYSGVEMDLRLSSDGVVVLAHDTTVSGTVGGVPTTYTVASETYATLSGLVLSNAVELLNGHYPFSELDFANGSVANGVWTPMSVNQNFSKRVGTPAPQKFDFDITISIDSGFKFGIVRYSDDAGTIMDSDTGWQTTPQVITAGTTFRFTIARATEIAEVASIPEFFSKCHISIPELSFDNGSVANGVWTPPSVNPVFSRRVGTPAPQKFDFDITISIDSGFRIGIVRYSDDAGTIMESDTKWQTTPQVITAGTTFRFTISRATEIDEVASIPEFLSKCHIYEGRVFPSKVPAFEDVLKFAVRAGMVYTLDLKITTAEFGTKVAKLVMRYGLQDSAIYQCNGSLAVMNAVAAVYPDSNFCAIWTGGVVTAYDTLMQSSRGKFILSSHANNLDGSVTMTDRNTNAEKGYYIGCYRVTKANLDTVLSYNPIFIEPTDEEKSIYNWYTLMAGSTAAAFPEVQW